VGDGARVGPLLERRQVVLGRAADGVQLAEAFAQSHQGPPHDEVEEGDCLSLPQVSFNLQNFNMKLARRSLLQLTTVDTRAEAEGDERAITMESVAPLSDQLFALKTTKMFINSWFLL
jgi:hypothetical protein